MSKLPAERAIYIPRAKRDLLVKNVKESNLLLESKAIKTPSENEANVREANVTTEMKNEMPPGERPKEIELYVPKGRKMLNEKKVIQRKSELEEMKSTHGTHSVTNDSLKYENLGNSKSPDTTKVEWNGRLEEKQYVPRIEDDEYFFGKLTDEKILLCCVIIDGFPSDISELVKNNTADYFIQRGALIQWRNASECVIVFRNERLLEASLSGWSNGICRTYRFSDKSENKDEILRSKGVTELSL